jgi:uncharacterized protein (UPF0332 family)
MNGRDFLDVAYDLLGGTREADWRSAVSRAYYAGFHCAREFFTAAAFKVPLSDQAHVYLWRRLGNSGHPDLKEAGLTMQHFRGLRNLADYDIGQVFEQTTAEKIIRRIDEIIQLLDELPNIPDALEKVVDQMRAYEKDVLREVTYGK